MTERNTKSNSLKNHFLYGLLLKVIRASGWKWIAITKLFKIYLFNPSHHFFVFFSAVKTFVVCSEMRMLVYPGFQKLSFRFLGRKKTSGNGGHLTKRAAPIGFKYTLVPDWRNRDNTPVIG